MTNQYDPRKGKRKPYLQSPKWKTDSVLPITVSCDVFSHEKERICLMHSLPDPTFIATYLQYLKEQVSFIFSSCLEHLHKTP